ncbi:MAG TPA: UDP-N-acetylmuramoyl-L-alanine--D-glutamate ligase [Candidatus Scatovivens faecipullorum]|nr:UDP-N-acetylmuramoyl-L-alanine--D-glutamate ligase [Candidatus Scatovivens faecipullorum]
MNEKLIEFNNYLKGRNVAVIGLGVSNIPLIDYLHNIGSIVTVFDSKEIDDIDNKILDKIINYGMSFSFGKEYLKKLTGFDLIFRSPSCLPTVPELEKEAKRGAIITTEIEMVIELTPGLVIGVTGSDGKTTTTTLIYEILKEDGYNCYLGGNIGIPLFDKIKDMQPEDIIVLELSSFQLMNMKISPKISVVTNITPNHLNIHSDMEEYVEAKKNIFKYQDKDGLLILNYDNEITRNFEKEAKGRVVFFSSKNKISNGYIVDDGKIKVCENGLRKHVFDTRNMKLRGIHNFENACCAIIATKELVKKESIDMVLTEFKGVEHRLELVKETKNRIKWYNDSVSSSPTRTIAGLNAFSLKNIILIAGGYDKNLDYSVLAKPIIDNCKALILLGQTSSKIEKAVNIELKKEKKELPIYKCESLLQTVNQANDIAVKGDIVLFSPASASFDMFKNFAERGDLFKTYVNKIVK